MQLVGVRVEVPTNQPIVLLREVDGDRSLPIFIGNPEATAIVHSMQGLSTPRPMTHDLLKTLLDDFGATLRSVTITELHERTFYADLEFDRAGTAMHVDARPSDAIALAVRCGIDAVAIFVADEVLDEAGVVVDDTEHDDDGDPDAAIEEFRSFLDQISPEDFA